MRFKVKNFKIYFYLTGLLLFVFILALLIFFSRQDQSESKVAFLDVGQGDAIYVRNRDTDILIDGGPNEKVINQISKLMPIYDRVFEMVVLTHPHADHLNGLIEVIKNYRVGKIVVNGINCREANCQAFNETVRNNKVSLLEAAEGQNFALPNGRLVVLSVLENAKDVNDSSVVTCLSLSGQTFLLTGDAGKKVEENFLKEPQRLRECQKPDVLKLGHHGSSTASSYNFLDYLKPRYAIISVGENNRFGHPHFETLQNLSKLKLETLRTDEKGTIVFTSKKANKWQLSFLE